MTDITPSGKPTLAFFFSPTSGPSRKVEALLAQVMQRRRNHERFALRRINADDSPDLVERFSVTTVPTLVVVDRHRVQGRLEGSFSCGDIERLLEPWLKRSTAEGPDEAGSSIYGRRSLNLPAELPFDRWRAIGRRIGVLADGSHWWLADWASYAGAAGSERYREALAVTGFEERALRNYAWVAEHFPPARRRDALSFAHHAEVAALPESAQDAWLDRAEQQGWSRDELRNALRSERRAREGADAPTEQVQLSVHVPQVELWRAAAEAEGLELTDWLSSVADEAARPADSSVRAA